MKKRIAGLFVSLLAVCGAAVFSSCASAPPDPAVIAAPEAAPQAPAPIAAPEAAPKAPAPIAAPAVAPKVRAPAAAPESAFEVTTVDGQVTITRYTGKAAAVRIPATIGGKPVVGIGYSAFANRKDITSVSIPAGVTAIGERAFAGCNSLTAINIPAGVTAIEASAFFGCTALSSVIMPESITRIGANAFTGCTGLASIRIPAGVTSIREGAFWECTGLTSIRIPAGVTGIGERAFENCTKLSTVSIPASVTTIEARAFYGCSSLASIRIPAGVTDIGERAFENCTKLSTVSIPASVTTIADRTFYGCAGLTSISIPGDVTGIGERAFENCIRLGAVSIPAGVTTIGARAFYGCSGLTSISIPAGISGIGDNAFSGCAGLDSVTVNVPASVSGIERGGFYRGAGLIDTAIQVDTNNVNYSSRDGVLFNTTGDTLIAYPAGLKGEYAIPQGVIRIADRAFSGSTGLSVVSIPASVTLIEDNTFTGSAGATVGPASIVVDENNNHYASRNGVLVSRTGELVMKALSASYEQVGPVEFRDGDWAVPVYGVYYYWAEGRLLPADLRSRYSEYDLVDFERYPAELPPWRTPGTAEADRFRAIAKDRQTNPPNRPPHFFDALYRARSNAESWDRVKQIYFLSRRVTVHSEIAGKLALVEERILREAKTNTALKQWVSSIKSAEGWNWRTVAATQSRSHHAYGAAVDLLPKSLGGKETYWLWAANRKVDWWAVPYTRRYHPPDAVIKAFEYYGFIWGGKWELYDTMHFEYRPELFLLNQ
ncbi:hypothetical protein FACS1894147_01190 [Spirochaetia bacterium]|nr:hypothetical protein FACS1894147_01190 [Spirochaetia bacterium]